MGISVSIWLRLFNDLFSDVKFETILSHSQSSLLQKMWIVEVASWVGNSDAPSFFVSTVFYPCFTHVLPMFYHIYSAVGNHSPCIQHSRIFLLIRCTLRLPATLSPRRICTAMYFSGRFSSSFSLEIHGIHGDREEKIWILIFHPQTHLDEVTR